MPATAHVARPKKGTAPHLLKFIDNPPMSQTPIARCGNSRRSGKGQDTSIMPSLTANSRAKSAIPRGNVLCTNVSVGCHPDGEQPNPSLNPLPVQNQRLPVERLIEREHKGLPRGRRRQRLGRDLRQGLRAVDHEKAAIGRRRAELRPVRTTPVSAGVRVEPTSLAWKKSTWSHTKKTLLRVVVFPTIRDRSRCFVA